jgi:hypothetical protein
MSPYGFSILSSFAASTTASRDRGSPRWSPGPCGDARAGHLMQSCQNGCVKTHHLLLMPSPQVAVD